MISSADSYLVMIECSLNACMLEHEIFDANLNFFTMPSSSALAKFAGGMVMTKCTDVSV